MLATGISRARATEFMVDGAVTEISRAGATEFMVDGAVNSFLSTRPHDSSLEDRRWGSSPNCVGDGSTDGSVLPSPDDAFISAGMTASGNTGLSVLAGGGMLAMPANALRHPGINGTSFGNGSKLGPCSTLPSPHVGDRPRAPESRVTLAER